MGIGVVAGRGFTTDDRVGAPYVTVVNEALAARLRDRFGMTDPVGQAVDLPALGFGRDRRATMTIVGVIGNERVQRDLRAPVDEIAYVPIAQAPRMQVKLSVHTARRRGRRRAGDSRGGPADRSVSWRWPTSARWKRSGSAACRD